MTQPPGSTPNDLASFLEALPFSALLLDRDHRVVAANASAVRELELDPETAVGGFCPHIARGDRVPADCPLNRAVLCKQGCEVSRVDPRTQQTVDVGVYPTTLRSPAGNQLYLHLFSDISRFQANSQRLCRNAEHHRALCELLQQLGQCRSSTEILQGLIDRVTQVSWLGVTSRATAFLVQGEELIMLAHRNIGDEQLTHCQRLRFGQCLCGQVAMSGKRAICGSDKPLHDIHIPHMQHHHHVVLPLRYEGRVLGVLNLYLQKDDHVDDYRLEFLEAAAAAAATVLAEQLSREAVADAQRKLDSAKRHYLERVIESQENERRRVSRELHDQLGQSLSALLLELGAHRPGAEDCEEVREGMGARIRGIIDQVRRMAWELRPAILDDYGLESAVARLIEQLSEHAAVAIDYQCSNLDGSQPRLPERVEAALYRIAQEALNNVVRHAHASQASVIVSRGEERVMLLVEDDGCGFDPTEASRNTEASLGLTGMAERVQLAGGTLTIESAPGQGTTLRAELPLNPQADARPAPDTGQPESADANEVGE
jgi:signal transduction histidine kinase